MKKRENMNVRVSKDHAEYGHSIGKKDNVGLVPIIEKGPSIINNLIVYLSHLEQSNKNLFGEIIIDLNDFTSKYGLSNKNLLEKIESNNQIQVEGINTRHTITNKFEEILVEFLRGICYVSTNQKGEPVLKSQQIISELVLNIKNDNTKKRKYRVKLNKEFKRNFLNDYINADINIYTKLKKKYKKSQGLQELYLFLERKKNEVLQKAVLENKKYNTLSYQFKLDDLIKRAKIFSSEPADQKKELNKKIEKLSIVSKLIKDELGYPLNKFDIELSWTKYEEERWSFRPVITYKFSDEFWVNYKKDRERTEELFQKFYKEELIATYPNTSKKYNLEHWIDDDKLDSQLKRTIYKKIWEDTFKTTCPDTYLNYRFK